MFLQMMKSMILGSDIEKQVTSTKVNKPFQQSAWIDPIDTSIIWRISIRAYSQNNLLLQCVSEPLGYQKSSYD